MWYITTMLASKSRTGRRQSDEITIQNYVCLLFVLSQSHMNNLKGPIFDCTGNPNHINSMLFWLTTGFNWYFAPIMGEHFTSPPPLPPAPLEKKERKISKVKFNFTYRPSWSGESYCDAFCWKSRWNWPLQHSQQVFAFPYAISLIRVRFEQFRKGDHLKAYIQ